MTTFLALAGSLLMAVGVLYVLVRAFQESALWGIGCVLVGPLLVVFAALHWDESRAGALATLAGLAVLLVGGSL